MISRQVLALGLRVILGGRNRELLRAEELARFCSFDG